MLKENLIIWLGFCFFIFYSLILLEMNFAVNFEVLGKVPNLVLIFLFFMLFFNLSFSQIPWEAIVAGLLMDVFSNHPIGVVVVLLFLESFLIKSFLKNLKEPNFLIFFVTFLAFQICFYSPLFVYYYFFERSSLFSFNFPFLVQIGYSLAIATAGFYLIKVLKLRFSNKNYV